MPISLIEEPIEKSELSEIAKERFGDKEIMTSKFQHQSLAAGGWASLSLAEQLGNIGSEVNRAIRARGDNKRFDGAVVRALELFDLTLSDPRWRKRLKEIARAREIF